MTYEPVVCANPDHAAKWLSTDARSAILAHWGNKCAHCLAPLASKGGETHFDHVLNGPHAGGCHHNGCNKSWNIAPVCAHCNITKGHQTFGADGAIYHAAVNVWFERGNNGTIPAIAAELSARFYSLLYSPVKGLERHFDTFPGAKVLTGKHYIRNTGDQYNPVWQILG